jgi:pyridoxine 5-phosphate synthase
LFIAPDEKQIETGARVGSQFVELHTGQFAEEFQIGRGSRVEGREPGGAGVLPSSLDPRHSTELQRLISGAKQAHALSLKVNAGHGLNYENLQMLFSVPHLVELNIGHSIVSRAVMVGLEEAVKEMLALMKKYRG